MEEERKKINGNSREILSFILVTLLVLFAEYLLYISKFTVYFYTYLQAKMISFFFQTPIQVLEYLISNIYLLLFSFIVFSLAILLSSILKIRFPLRILFILPCFLFLPLFNSSISFIFFNVGIFFSLIFAKHFGDMYREELKRHISFRYGARITSKLLGCSILLLSIGVFLQTIMYPIYSEVYIREMVTQLTDIMEKQYNQLTPSKEDIIKKELEQVSSLYNLTEEQKKELEEKIREKYKDFSIKKEMSSLIKQKLYDSDFIKYMRIWFPYLSAFYICAIWGILNSFIFSPLSGCFSVIFFKLFKKEERIS